MPSLTLSAFDTLKYAQRLKAADVPEKQAEAQAEALREALADQAAAQSDVTARAVNDLDTKTEKAIVQLETKLGAKIAQLDAKLDMQIARLDTKIDLVRKDMVALEDRLIIKLSAVMVALIAFSGAVLAIVNRLS